MSFFYSLNQIYKNSKKDWCEAKIEIKSASYGSA